MSKVFEIIPIGHPTLRSQASKVKESEINTNDFNNFLDTLERTRGKANGVGLAAPQVGCSKQIFVTKIPKDLEDTYICCEEKVYSSRRYC